MLLAQEHMAAFAALQHRRRQDSLLRSRHGRDAALPREPLSSGSSRTRPVWQSFLNVLSLHRIFHHEPLPASNEQSSDDDDDDEDEGGEAAQRAPGGSDWPPSSLRSARFRVTQSDANASIALLLHGATAADRGSGVDDTMGGSPSPADAERAASPASPAAGAASAPNAPWASLRSGHCVGCGARLHGCETAKPAVVLPRAPTEDCTSQHEWWSSLELLLRQCECLADALDARCLGSGSLGSEKAGNERAALEAVASSVP